jgi:hypothetical protein
VLGRLCVTYKTGSGLDDLIYWHLIHSTGNYRQYSAITDLHNLQFTVTHALGFSVFTSHILATDLQQSHCHFKSHMKTSLHSLTPFLALFGTCQFRTLSSSAPKLISRQAGVSQLDSLLKWTLLYNSFALTTQRIQLLYCYVAVFTAPLRSNGSSSIVASVFVAAEICLPSRCLAMKVYYGTNIPAFGRNVTVY